MKKTLVFLLQIMILQAFVSYKAYTQNNWDRKQIGAHNFVNKLIIADGRNDGVNRLYGATFTGDILEWTYNQETGSWTKVLCARISEDPNGYSPSFYQIYAGQGKNDGKICIYGANLNGWTYEFYYNNETDEWENIKLGNGGFNKPQGVLVGDARNDGLNRIITSGTTLNGTTTPIINEFTWDDTENIFESAYVKNSYRYAFAGTLGDGRNEELNNIYLPDVGYKCLWEYKWNGTSYVEKSIPMGMMPHRVVMGDAHNDGKNRIYVAEGFSNTGGIGVIKELSYVNGVWSKKTIHSNNFPGYGRHELAVANARNDDDENRLYTLARNGALIEHTYVDDSWEREEIDAISGATATIEVGDARNDNINRIYITGDGQAIYEFTHGSYTTINENATLSKKVRNYPNPVSNLALFDYTLEEQSDVKLSVFNNQGQKVYCQVYPNQNSGENTIKFEVSNYESGTYVYKLEANGICLGSDKMVLVK